MYNPLSGCSAVLHLLIKHPVLVVGLGLAGAVTALTGNSDLDKAPENLVVYEQKAEVISKKLELNEALVISAEKAKNIRAIIDELEKDEALRDAQSRIDGSSDIPAAVVDESVSRVSEKWFSAIKMAESNNQPLGVHPDGVSYGPAGMTEMALTDVFERQLPDCRTLGFDEILNDPETSEKFAYLYFLDLIHEFKDVETAVIAYNYGKTRVRKLLTGNTKLPDVYLNRVKKYLK